MKNIILIGYMATGKSTISLRLSKRLGIELWELDEMIVSQLGISINEIFEKYGEDYFRDLETKTLKKCLNKDSTIISCGGGIVLKEENVALMRDNGIVICLKASEATIFERIKETNDRPLLKNVSKEEIAKMMEKREPYYNKASHYNITVDNKSIDEVSNEIIEIMGNII